MSDESATVFGRARDEVARRVGTLSQVARIDHLVEPLEDGARVVVTTDVEGPGADDVGAMVTAEAPAAVALLTGLAEGTRTAS